MLIRVLERQKGTLGDSTVLFGMACDLKSDGLFVPEISVHYFEGCCWRQVAKTRVKSNH